MQVKNQNGEELFLVIITNSKEFNDPTISLKTWAEAKEMFEKKIRERNDDSYMVKQVTVTRDEDLKRLRAQILCNHKGWGVDYFECIKVEKAYAF
jgi:hypothetical protein